MDTTLWLSIAAIAVLLFLSGLFSGSETALTAASRARMHQLTRKGNRRARVVGELIDRKERLIGAILLGNNLVNILASALATSILINLFGDAGVVYATVIMTLLVLIFAEVLPKTYALKKPDRAALALAPVMKPIVVVLSPAVRLIQGLVAHTLRLFGADGIDADDLTDVSEELKGAIYMHTAQGTMVKTDRDMLDAVLDLADVDLADIMIHRRDMAMIDVSETPVEVMRQMLDGPYTRIPLWRDNPENIIGILHAKDLLKAISRADGKVDELDPLALARAPWFVPETTTLREQLTAFRERHEHFALVVDEYGALMGLVTLEDIIEEIVGDIADEHDTRNIHAVRRQSDGSYVVDGATTVRDLNRHYDWHLPEDDAATIAGLVIHSARNIPDVGEHFTFYGFEFEILRRQKNRVTSLRIRAAKPAA